ncbi:site-2 protease family protein [Brucepastera parasyntrophica]|uniref:site-2 protease family protein n=1 Tax=Brucepastera parasyntrophica TaxID=2880008 RepID=UPI003F70486A
MLKILIGLVALGVVIFVHELGHFIAARCCGVEVETFSLGWGPVLFRKKIGTTEYRLSLFPIGGYCGMKGEQGFREALEKNLDAIPAEKGSLYSVHPLKRMIIAFSGPLANLLFAVISLSIVSSQGYTYYSYDNKIIPASVYDNTLPAPADIAGLQKGDRIISMNNEPIRYFSDIQQYVGLHPQEEISLEYERNGEIFSSVLTPTLDKKTGLGRIGVYPYVSLVIDKVLPDSAAEAAGLEAGDEIIAVNAEPVTNSIEFSGVLAGKPELISLTVSRNGGDLQFEIAPVYKDDGSAEIGIAWIANEIIVPGTGFLKSIQSGFSNTWRTIVLTIKSIGLLFRGVDLREAVSGPVRITVMLGEVAQNGLTSVMELLSIICVSLFLMNLLPIPILDGGLILFALIELIYRKPIKPKIMYRVQYIGVGFIVCLFIFALFGDIHYLIK